MKLNIYRLTIMACIFIIAATGCDKREATLFEDQARIYFYHDKYSTMWDDAAGHSQGDSIVFSVKSVEDWEDTYTYHIIAQTIGNVTSYDRTFSVRQSNAGEENAAIAGTNYTPFSQLTDRLIVPAGKTQGMIPVVIQRNDDIAEREVVLELELVPNENFLAGFEDMMKIRFYFSDMYTKPTVWDVFYAKYLGLSWGQVKFDFLVRYVTGNVDWEDSQIAEGLVEYWGIMAREMLEEFENENGPLMERDGVTRVSFDE